jgi:hypothetical protein
MVGCYVAGRGDTDDLPGLLDPGISHPFQDPTRALHAFRFRLGFNFTSGYFPSASHG